MATAGIAYNAVMSPLPLEFLVSLELARWRSLAYVWTSEHDCDVFAEVLVESGVMIASQICTMLSVFIFA